MTREQAIAALQEIPNKKKTEQFYDTESAHIEADAVLCNLLEALGYADVVEAWAELDKWYA